LVTTGALPSVTSTGIHRLDAVADESLPKAALALWSRWAQADRIDPIRSGAFRAAYDGDMIAPAEVAGED
jgi:hypothetical protein